MAEETAFNRTLASGSRLFDEAARTTRASGTTVLSGTDAFTLHDTYGFPLELTLEMAAEAGLSVDEEGFRGMAEQRQRAKADAAARKQAHSDLSAYRELVDAGPTEFTGFDELVSEATILGIFVDGRRVPVVTHGGNGDQPPDRVELILDRTPFYAESGGQIADEGSISRRLWCGEGRRHRRAEDRQNAVGASRQRGVRRVRRGRHRDRGRRPAVAARRDAGPFRHPHGACRTATSAGPQRGSGRLAEPAGLSAVRLQLAGPLTEDQRTQIEEVTNEAVEADYEVHSFTTELEKAKAMGAMALFGEAYPDEVRVVEIGGPFSLELCGGTHVHNSAQIGPVTILGEASVGSGVRRVEAYVGLDSFRHLAKERADGGAGVVAEGAVRGGAGPGGQSGGAVEGRREGTRPMRLANARAAAAMPPRVPSRSVRSVSWRSGWPAGCRRRICAASSATSAASSAPNPRWSR